MKRRRHEQQRERKGGGKRRKKSESGKAAGDGRWGLRGGGGGAGSTGAKKRTKRAVVWAWRALPPRLRDSPDVAHPVWGQLEQDAEHGAQLLRQLRLPTSGARGALKAKRGSWAARVYRWLFVARSHDACLAFLSPPVLMSSEQEGWLCEQEAIFCRLGLAMLPRGHTLPRPTPADLLTASQRVEQACAAGRKLVVLVLLRWFSLVELSKDTNALEAALVAALRNKDTDIICQALECMPLLWASGRSFRDAISQQLFRSIMRLWKHDDMRVRQRLVTHVNTVILCPEHAEDYVKALMTVCRQGAEPTLRLAAIKRLNHLVWPLSLAKEITELLLTAGLEDSDTELGVAALSALAASMARRFPVIAELTADRPRFVEALVRRSCLPCTPGVESLVQLAANSVVSNYTLLAPHFRILPVELQSMLRHEAAFSPDPQPAPPPAPMTMRGAVYWLLSLLAPRWDDESLREVLQVLSPFLSRSMPWQLQESAIMLLGCIAQHANCGTEAVRQHLPFVAESLAHHSPKVRAAACWSLRGFPQPPPELHNALIERVGSTDPRICYAAMTTLRHATQHLTAAQLEGLVTKCCAARHILTSFGVHTTQKNHRLEFEDSSICRLNPYPYSYGFATPWKVTKGFGAFDQETKEVAVKMKLEALGLLAKCLETCSAKLVVGRLSQVMEFVLAFLDSPFTEGLAFDCLSLVVRHAKTEHFSPFVDHVAWVLKIRLDQPPDHPGGGSTLWNSALGLLSGLIQAGCDIDHHIPLTFALSLIDNSAPTVPGSYSLLRAIGTRHPGLITSMQADMVAGRVSHALACHRRNAPLWTEAVLTAGWLVRARGAELPESWAAEVAQSLHPYRALSKVLLALLGHAACTVALLGLHHAAAVTATPTAVYLIASCVTLTTDDGNFNKSVYLGYARLLAHLATHGTDNHQSLVMNGNGTRVIVCNAANWLLLLRSFITHMDRYHHRLAGDAKTKKEEEKLEASVRAGFVALVARVRPEDLADEIRSDPERKSACVRLLSRYLGPRHPFVERSCAGGDRMAAVGAEDVHRADGLPRTINSFFEDDEDEDGDYEYNDEDD